MAMTICMPAGQHAIFLPKGAASRRYRMRLIRFSLISGRAVRAFAITSPGLTPDATWASLAHVAGLIARAMQQQLLITRIIWRAIQRA